MLTLQASDMAWGGRCIHNLLMKRYCSCDPSATQVWGLAPTALQAAPPLYAATPPPVCQPAGLTINLVRQPGCCSSWRKPLKPPLL